MDTKGYNATVIQKILMTPNLMTLRVRPDEELADFKPGQYTVLGLKNSEARLEESQPDKTTYEKETLIKRAYSISSASVEKEYLEFYISLVRSGQLTPRLFALEQNSRIFLGSKIVGMFTLDSVPAEKNLLFIATGTGLAPYMSMIRSELHLHRARKFIVVHGAACSWDLGYRDELSIMDRLSDNFTYIPTITQPEDDVTWKGDTGFIQDLLTSGVIEGKGGEEITPEKYDVFLCGNPRMVETVTENLVERGFKQHSRKDPGTIHTEEFWK
jgi:ferredoxin--NADP+ reductase